MIEINVNGVDFHIPELIWTHGDNGHVVAQALTELATFEVSVSRQGYRTMFSRLAYYDDLEDAKTHLRNEYIRYTKRRLAKITIAPELAQM